MKELRAMDAIEQALMQRTPDEQRRRDQQRAENVDIGNSTQAFPVAEFMTPEQLEARAIFVSEGRQVVVLPEDETSGQRAVVMQLADFTETYKSSGELIERDDGNSTWRSFVEGWRNSRQRKSVAATTMAIGRPREWRTDTGAPAVNLWTPTVRREPRAGAQEKVRLFLDHLAYLIPNEGERRQFLLWLAHAEQKPQELPHHGYLMFTESFGIGRNALASILARVWPGEVAASVNLPALIDSSFNGQIAGKRLAVVDEVYVNDFGKSRYAIENRLRQLITEETRVINPKYGRQYTEWNVLRWLLFSNHADGLPMPAHDRRFAVIANPTERHPDGADYYARLYAALADPEFIQAVSWHLAKLDITEFNPGATPAVNDAKRAVIEATTPELEKELRAVIAEWPSPIAAAGDLLVACGLQPDDTRHSSYFTKSMKALGHQKIDARPRIGGVPTRLWELRGKGALPDDLAAEVARYRAAPGFRGLAGGF